MGNPLNFDDERDERDENRGNRNGRDRGNRTPLPRLPKLRKWIWVFCLLWFLAWGVIGLTSMNKPAIVFASTVTPPLLFGYVVARALDSIFRDEYGR